MPSEAAITDIEQLKDHPALATLLGVMRDAVRKQAEPFEALRAWLDKAGDRATAMR